MIFVTREGVRSFCEATGKADCREGSQPLALKLTRGVRCAALSDNSSMCFKVGQGTSARSGFRYSLFAFLVAASVGIGFPLSASAGPRHMVIRVGGPSGPDQPKLAVVAGPRSLKGQRFKVQRVSESKKIVLRGRLGLGKGDHRPWESAFTANLSRVIRPGRYVVIVGRHRSRPWRITRNASTQPIDHMLRFFRINRDGYESSPAHGPSHLNDATVHPDSPIDPGKKLSLTGGWMDAGDMIHFTQTTAFSTALLEAAARLAPANRDNLAAEANVGLRWLMAAHPSPGLFIAQVGDRRDHAVGFRDPAVDDYSRRPGIGSRFAYPEVGGDISGKVATALALGYLRTGDPAMLTGAREWYSAGKSVKRPARPLNEAGYPAYGGSFYESRNWKDSMASGAAELFRASCAAGACDDSYQADFLRWLADSRQTEPNGTIGAFDDFASFGEAEACNAFGGTSGIFSKAAKSRACLLLRQNGQIARRQANSNAFGMPGYFTWGTSAQNGAAGALAALATVADKNKQPGCQVAAGARDWLLGRNPFGTSFVVGYGPRAPRDPLHWTSAVGGSEPTGGVVGGPAPRSELSGAGFTIKGWTARVSFGFSGYEENHNNQLTSEPALDYTGSSILLLAALERHC